MQHCFHGIATDCHSLWLQLLLRRKIKRIKKKKISTHLIVQSWTERELSCDCQSMISWYSINFVLCFTVQFVAIKKKKIVYVLRDTFFHSTLFINQFDVLFYSSLAAVGLGMPIDFFLSLSCFLLQLQSIKFNDIKRIPNTTKCLLLQKIRSVAQRS